MASQAESVVDIAGEGRRRRPVHVLVTELSASGLLLVLVAHDLIDNVIVEAITTGAIVLGLMLVTRSQLNPIETFVRVGREELSFDRAAAVIGVQLAGGALGGCVSAAFIDLPPVSADVLSWTALIEGVTASGVCAAALAFRSPTRERFIALPTIAAAACGAGSRWLGNPSLVFRSAFAAVLSGSSAYVGELLLAQLVGAILVALVWLAFRKSVSPGD